MTQAQKTEFKDLLSQMLHYATLEKKDKERFIEIGEAFQEIFGKKERTFQVNFHDGLPWLILELVDDQGKPTNILDIKEVPLWEKFICLAQKQKWKIEVHESGRSFRVCPGGLWTNVRLFHKRNPGYLLSAFISLLFSIVGGTFLAILSFLLNSST